MEDDGDVVRSEIPSHVNVSLEEAQVQTARIDVADFADVAGANDLPDLLHRGGIEKRVADHQHNASAFRDLDQLLTLRRGGGHRLLNKGVFAGQQACFGQ